MSNSNYRIAHITTVHPRYDIRIFLKEVCSISNYEAVFLIVADGLGDDKIHNICIKDVGRSKNRWNRMFYSVFKMLFCVLKTDVKLVHFHDPELLIIVPFLKLFGRKVVYDVHENVHKQILSKSYIPALMRGLASKSFFLFETFICNYLNGIVCATPAIARRFSKYSEIVSIINNFQLQDELMISANQKNKKEKSLIYIGAITIERGIKQLVDAVGLLNGKCFLNLAGTFENDALFNEVSQKHGWKYVKFFGQIGRAEISDLLNSSVVGVVNFLPAPNHMESQPNKMFEYMSAGLPILCSDFPLWEEIVIQNNCGITINPLSPISIAHAIDQLLSDDIFCRTLGENGRIAVLKKYNWLTEEKKLVHLYEVILDQKYERKN